VKSASHTGLEPLKSQNELFVPARICTRYFDSERMIWPKKSEVVFFLNL